MPKRTRTALCGASATSQPGATRDARVQAERDRRAAHRAVAQWANDNTADLRQLTASSTSPYAVAGGTP